MTQTLYNTKTSHHGHYIRALLDALFFLLIVLGPWWLACIVGLGVLFIFGAYEAVVGGVLLDMLYSNLAGTFLQAEFFFTILFLVATSIAYVVRQKARTHLRF